ncbi:hypothetical protein TNCT_491461 [Trichonephila clavata]|uniref:Uncharacterized protein n=1 Tax=Trichonephila clavata TaxID=2740835 RepID=A0A8X6KKH5_TRICU|nr:hypothetical protein TNCT_491461 [Trichonephila clavata]
MVDQNADMEMEIQGLSMFSIDSVAFTEKDDYWKSPSWYEWMKYLINMKKIGTPCSFPTKYIKLCCSLKGWSYVMVM